MGVLFHGFMFLMINNLFWESRGMLKLVGAKQKIKRSMSNQRIAFIQNWNVDWIPIGLHSKFMSISLAVKKYVHYQNLKFKKGITKSNLKMDCKSGIFSAFSRQFQNDGGFIDQNCRVTIFSSLLLRPLRVYMPKHIRVDLSHY